jgi:hypothetical protein
VFHDLKRLNQIIFEIYLTSSKEYGMVTIRAANQAKSVRPHKEF